MKTIIAIGGGELKKTILGDEPFKLEVN